MKSRTKIILVLLIAICGIVPASLIPLYGQSDQEIFAAANKLYMDEKFDKAIEKYEQLVTMKKVSADVYFNLGNAYYKTGNFASSILNYERAQRLSPSDPDIEYNLRMANLSTIDKIEPLPRVFYEKWWDDFVNEGSVSIRAMWVIILLFSALAVFALYLFVNKIVIRKVSFFVTIGLVAASLFTWYLTHMQYKHLNNHKGAVIFSDSAYIKSSPDEKSSNLFLLHSGTRIEVLDELSGWKKIRIANGSEGWIVADALVII